MLIAKQCGWVGRWDKAAMSGTTHCYRSHSLLRSPCSFHFRSFTSAADVWPAVSSTRFFCLLLLFLKAMFTIQASIVDRAILMVTIPIKLSLSECLEDYGSSCRRSNLACHAQGTRRRYCSVTGHHRTRRIYGHTIVFLCVIVNVFVSIVVVGNSGGDARRHFGRSSQSIDILLQHFVL